MDWNRHRRRIYANIGVDVVWTPVSTGIAAAAVKAFFDNPYYQSEFGGGAVQGRQPVVDLVEDDFAGLARGDLLTISGSNYRVKQDPERDGLGGMLVHLSGPISSDGILLEDDSAILLEDDTNLELEA